MLALDNSILCVISYSGISTTLLSTRIIQPVIISIGDKR